MKNCDSRQISNESLKSKTSNNRTPNKWDEGIEKSHSMQREKNSNMTKIGKKCFDKNYQHEKNKGEKKDHHQQQQHDTQLGFVFA